jgi:UDP-N-acetylmuramoylalanine--D-glutamate ligase
MSGPDVKRLRRVAVLGLGASGLAAVRLLRMKGVEVNVRDEGTTARVQTAAETARGLGAFVRLGPGEVDLGDVREFDLGIISPGMDPRVGIPREVFDARIPIWSEIELGYRFCECPIAAVTGTNGKTTTTELIDAVMRAGGKRSLASGNIGFALCDAVEQSSKLDVMVVECSSFQLEQIVDFHPRVAVLTNLTPDHLDRYRTMAEYLAAKVRIFENQGAGDAAVIHASLAHVKVRADRVTFSAMGHEADYTLGGGVILHRGKPVVDMKRTRLVGPHNAENAMCAIAAGRAFGVPDADITRALEAFEPARHRCELVATVEGVRYVNDSKATNTDAVAKALLAADGPVVLIAGGKDKGFDFDDIAPLVREHARAVVLIGETAEKIERQWPGVRCVRAKDMASAVAAARREARAGDTVLLSPACASFDMFQDYKDRGDQFCARVRGLK